MASLDHLKDGHTPFPSSSSDPAIRLFGTIIAPPLSSLTPTLVPTPTMEEVEKEKQPLALSSHAHEKSVPVELVEPPDGAKCPPLPKLGGVPVPCPRCDSLETKFCYYNNYNVNQPRRFCKACHRYWTEGGNLRNVPVGSGRRKSKGKQLPLLIPTADDTTAFVRDHFDPAKPYALDGGLTSAGKTPLATKDEEEAKIFAPIKTGAITPENVQDLATAAVGGYYAPTPFGGVPPWLPCAPNVSFPLAAMASLGCNSTMGDPRWNPYGWAAPWTMMPWNAAAAAAATAAAIMASTPTMPPSLNRPIPNLDNRAEALICVPKTLQISDPGVAAQSSIHNTLGLHMRSDRGTFFNGFKPKAELYKPKATVRKGDISLDPSGCANPVALSRSVAFHESH